jgi:hypothetical protein
MHAECHQVVENFDAGDSVFADGFFESALASKTSGLEIFLTL